MFVQGLVAAVRRSLAVPAAAPFKRAVLSEDGELILALACWREELRIPSPVGRS